MSFPRRCPNCYQVENLRVNFGDEVDEDYDPDAERRFHAMKWCNCGYNSPEEMMLDQDMGFTDPAWIPIAKYFLNIYLLRLSQGEINSKEEHMRFFLKLLKSAANNFHKSLELVPRKEDEIWKLIYDGKSTHKPKTKIFRGQVSYRSKEMPSKKPLAWLYALWNRVVL